MTAVIGILNKSGVALAADSAVTISGGNGRKIYNSAYKIITLSKYHPVGIMLYSSASFMGIPWEVLIKEYRKGLGKRAFDTLKEYQTDFIEYLRTNLSLVSSEIQDEVLASMIKYISRSVITDITKVNIKLIDSKRTVKGKKEIIKKKLGIKLKELLLKYESEVSLNDFSDYSYEKYKKKHKEVLNMMFDKYYSSLDLSAIVKSRLFKVIHHLISSNYFLGNWTGLVFTGYGTKEIYPSCLPIKVGEVIDGRIRWKEIQGEGAVISDNLRAAIRPFAQRDVIDTILSGIDLKLEDTIFSTFSEFLKSFIKILTDKIGDDDKALKGKIGNINVEELINDYSTNFQELKREKHIKPLMSAVASLSKEDLAELAESLVYLTYLKRRMSGSEESVGGPIDVAIITKGDGFVWIKRKHYFSSDLNKDFIYKYLNK